MKKKLVVCKVKEGKLDLWKEWAEKLEVSLREEALDTLIEEEVTCEFGALINLEGVQYVLGYMEGEILGANMDREINQKHKAMREECLEYVDRAEFLYHLRTA